MAVTWFDAPAPRAGEITKALADELVVDRVGTCIPILGEAHVSGGDITGIAGSELDLRASITNLNIVAGRAYTARGGLIVNGSTTGNAFGIRIREGAAPVAGAASAGAVVVERTWTVTTGGNGDYIPFHLKWIATANDNDGDFHLSALRVVGAGTLTVMDLTAPDGSSWEIGEIG